MDEFDVDKKEKKEDIDLLTTIIDDEMQDVNLGMNVKVLS